MSTGYAIGRLTIIEISGADRNKIANNLCTQDLRTLADGQTAETFVLDVKGRTLSHGIVCGWKDSLWFVSAPGQAERLVPHFDRYIIREDAVIADRSAEFTAALFPNAKSASQILPGVPDPMPAHSCIEYTLQGASIRCLHAPWIGNESLLAIVPASVALTGWLPELRALVSSDTSHRSDWELQRIEAFWPWAGIDFDDKNLPQELSIDKRTISFKKGCYLGQETVARLDALGQVQKRLVKLRIQGSDRLPIPYAMVLEGKEVGSITSMASMPEGDSMALGMLRRSHFQPGTEMLIDGRVATVLRVPE
jgi:folate-binding protein YgfZ